MNKYYVPHQSIWPIVGAVGLFIAMAGFSLWLNETAVGKWLALLGGVTIIFMVFGWFGDVIRENQKNMYGTAEDASFRMGMFWFIASEVAFFAAFFGALFYARQMSVPWLAGEGSGFFTKALLHTSFEGGWPTNGPAAAGGTYTPMPWQGLPIINTIILLSSSVTITFAHHALREHKRASLKLWLGATVILGFVFVFFQAQEYIHAYRDLNLTMGTGVYGSTFFLLTGFHGLHVTLGATMLLVMWIRVMRGHFTKQKHFAFEASAWYWHFVDVVWLFLFVFVYIL